MKNKIQYQFSDINKYFKELITLSVLLFGFTQLSAQKFWELIDQETVNLKEVQDEANLYFSNHPTGKGSGFKLYKRWEYEAQRNLDDNGYVISSTQELKQLKIAKKKNAKSRRSSTSDDWEDLGPNAWTRTTSWSPGLGRITAIAVEPTLQQVIFAGSPGGGLWRSTDAGASWTPLGDDFDDMQVWAVEIDPSNPNTVYYGNLTGEIYKSTDQGNTWAVLGDYGYKCRRILVHPTNSNIVFLSTGSGVYKSTNGGSSFVRVITSSIEDIEFKPGDPSTVYASGSRFYKSTDSGNTFVSITQGIGFITRTKLAVTSANSSYVYLIQNQGNGFGRVLRSTDSGTSFTVRNDISVDLFNYLGSQAYRDMAIMVSQTDPNEVHIGGLNHYRSLDGGDTFTGLATWSAHTDPSYVHADIEVMKYVGTSLYVGSDGGIFRSTNQGNNYEDLTQNGLSVHQFYKIGGSRQNSNKVTGGSQDNGTIMMKGTDRSFVSWAGADGMESFFDPFDENVAYQAIQYGNQLGRTETSGETRSVISKPVSASNVGNWVIPFAADPITPNTIYTGYDELYRHRDRGNYTSSWESLTDDITGSRVTEFAISPSNNDYLYVTFGSKFYRTSNGTATSPSWVEITSSDYIYINHIDVDPNDEKHVVVCGSNGEVQVSEDAGATWVTMTGLPSITVQVVVFDNADNNGIYAGLTKGGVYYTNDDQSDWTHYSTNLPNVEVRDLEIDYASNHIRVGTYGRGLWESPINTIQTVNLVAPSGVTLSKDNSTGDVTISWVDNSLGEIGHRIEFAANSTSTDFIEIAATSDVTYLEDLFTNTNYVFRVRSVDALGNFSAYSAVASFDTEVDFCEGIPLYDNNFLYLNAGHQVVYQGDVYENTQTVQGNIPTNVAAPWTFIATCSSASGYTINASAGANGSISPNGIVNVLSGGNTTFTIAANSGYSISDVLVDNVSQGNITSHTFNNVTADHTISATFILSDNNGNNCTAPDWDASVVYDQTGTEVVYGGVQYASLWWNQNNAPGEGSNDPWRVVKNCDGSGINCSSYPDYSNNTLYSNSGTRVVYQNSVYSNNWTVQGNPPVNNPTWTFIGACAASTEAAPILTGTEEELAKSNFAIHVLIWPNPSKDIINVNFDAPVRNASFELINVSGEVVASKVLLNNTMLSGLDVSELSKGIYYLRVTGDRLNQTISVVVE